MSPLRLPLLLLFLSLISAAPTTAPSKIYRMVAVTIDGGDPKQWVLLIITPEGYAWATTPSSLQDCIRRRIPKSATLQWVPQDTKRGGEPLESEADMSALEHFCNERDIRFVVIPAG